MLEENRIDTFRQILIWPLALQHPDLKAGAKWHAVRKTAKIIDEQVKAICDSGGAWKLIPDKAKYLTSSRENISPEEKRHIYAEHVYFHRFVQKFLYEDDDAIRIFCRNDVGRIQADLTWDRGTGETERVTYDLRVERCHLYFFSAGTVALVVEVCSDDITLETLSPDLAGSTWRNQLFLGDALHLANRLRRSYPAYFDKTTGVPGEFPDTVVWLDQDRKPLGKPEPDNWHAVVESFAERDNHRIPIANYWRHLLLPLHVEGMPRTPRKDETVWRHVVDDRMPTMLYLAVQDPCAIKDGDWMRLCFCDGPGKPDGFPYAEPFMRASWKEHTYDRYWGSGMTTRYLCSGYNFAVVCQSGERFSEIIEQHFRRHYFQIGLILHFQYATLLAKSANISEAVTSCGPQDERFSEAIEAIHRDLLTFTHRFWFTGVSNQLQARELYSWWRGLLGLTEAYEEVMNEARSAYDFLNAERQRRQAEAATKLNVFVAITVPLALTVGFFGMNLVVDPGPEGSSWGAPDQWQMVLGFFAGGFLVTGLTLLVMFKPKTSGSLRGFLFWTRIASFAFGVAFATAAWRADWIVQTVQRAAGWIGGVLGG